MDSFKAPSSSNRRTMRCVDDHRLKCCQAIGRHPDVSPELCIMQPFSYAIIGSQVNFMVSRQVLSYDRPMYYCGRSVYRTVGKCLSTRKRDDMMANNLIRPSFTL